MLEVVEILFLRSFGFIADECFKLLFFLCKVMKILAIVRQLLVQTGKAVEEVS